jgi:transcriptional regulator with XRE-family HTH domain
MPPGRPPTLRLRRLAAELRRLRAEAGLTREEVTARTGVNGATLYRLETAKARPQARTLVALLDLYEITAPDQRADFQALARQSDEQSWLQSFPPELAEAYATYISFEGEASSLLNYECLFIPGLLQTEDYARAALSRGMPTATKEEVGRQVEARMSRQAVLTHDPPLQLWAIVDEAALHRPVGGTAVMQAQLAHLSEAAEPPNVTLQVLPYSVGAHPGMPGSFALLRFADAGAGDVVYIETQASSLFLESDTDLGQFTTIFEYLRALALPPDTSVELIHAIARDL